MDGNQTAALPEKQPNQVAATEKLSPGDLEAKVAPASNEAAQNQPKRDDGTSVAQAQVASVVADDQAQAASDPTTGPVTTRSTPLTAADVDVIEPEWVKKAEEVVAKHRDDPRAEEYAVEEVQRDYLKKRYNLDVKSSDDKP